jgi:hypothetical protein
MYYPLSQITTNLSTTKEELLVLNTGLPYKGKYYTTSDGKFFSGASPQDGDNLILIENPIFSTTNPTEPQPTLPLNSTPLSYKRSISFSISNANSPISQVVFPTDEEYTTGEFTRYFLKKINQNTYLETNQFTFNNFTNQNLTAQYELYTPTSLSWNLTGDPINTYKTNKNIVLLSVKNLKWPGFELWFKSRYVKYYQNTTQSFFTTKGGELKTESTSENYAGFYHVNPNRGIMMEGKLHKNTFHNTLIPFKEDEIIGKIKVGINNEVGTSIRKNY